VVSAWRTVGAPPAMSTFRPPAASLARARAAVKPPVMKRLWSGPATKPSTEMDM